MGRFITVIFVLLLIGCSPYDEKDITVTKDYVINPNWDKQNNRFDVKVMKPKEGSASINPENATSLELLNNLIEDEKSSYGANVKYNGKDYSERKVHFNQEDNFVWRKPPNIDPNRDTTYKTIGALKKETWYLLGGLSKVNTLYYIYISSSGKLYKVRVPASDWTNI